MRRVARPNRELPSALGDHHTGQAGVGPMEGQRGLDGILIPLVEARRHYETVVNNDEGDKVGVHVRNGQGFVNDPAG